MHDERLERKGMPLEKPGCPVFSVDSIVMQDIGGVGHVYYVCNTCNRTIEDVHFVGPFIGCDTCRSWTTNYSVKKACAVVVGPA